MSLISRVDKSLEGAPEGFITLGLIVVAAIALFLAWKATPTVKALALAWMVAP